MNLFKNSSVLVLRVADYATQGFGNGVSLPVYVDEVDPTGIEAALTGSANVQSLEMPTTCTLATGGVTTPPNTIW